MLLYIRGFSTVMLFASRGLCVPVCFCKVGHKQSTALAEEPLVNTQLCIVVCCYRVLPNCLSFVIDSSKV